FMLGLARAYFWPFECLWACILYTLFQRGNPAFWLRYLPHYMDELIILPLPLTVALIVKAYQDNSAHTQQTIQYLTTSTNQQQIAAQAIVYITVSLLSRCQSPREIASIANRLDWLPSPAPKELG